MEKGTIIYVGAFEMPDRNAAAHRVCTVGKIFEQLGFHTVFLARAAENDEFEGIRKSGFGSDIYEISAPHTTKQWLRYMLDVSYIEAVAEKYDDVRMIILYDMPYFAYLAAKKRFCKTKIKVIYDCAEWADATEGSPVKRIYKKADDFLIRKLLAKKTSAMIVISNMMKSAYEKDTVILKLPPMVDINDAVWHQERILNKDKFEFCFAGTIGSSKESPEKIIYAFSNIKDKNVSLRIIGVTKEDFCQSYPDFAGYANDERIIFMGRLSHTDTIKYVLSCDCYIFIRKSSRKNNAGFPTKFVEAFTCNVPIITTDTSDIRDYLKPDFKLSVLESFSDEKIEEAMKNEISSKRKTAENLLNDTFYYEKYIDMTAKWLNSF